MALSGKKYVIKRVVFYEKAAFLIIFLIIWIDELLDLPALLLGAEATPVNWRESIFESACIAFLGIVIIRFTNTLHSRLKYLEGILPICTSCKKIRDGKNNWHNVEEYINEKSDAEFTKGICPECAKKLYQDIVIDGKV